MKFESLYSSSAGNLYRVTADTGEQLIIDPGVTWKKLIAALDFKINKIVGCLITHLHFDHYKSALDMLKQGIDVYSAIELLENEILPKQIFSWNPLQSLIDFSIEPFVVFPFPVLHDIPNTGFVIKQGRESLFFAVDCSNIEYYFTTPFTYIAIGCSYDIEVLKQREKNKTINRRLAERLLTAHMEKGKVIKYLTEKCNLSQCKEIYLLHMSRDNLEREKIRKEIQHEVYKATGRAIPFKAAEP